MARTLPQSCSICRHSDVTSSECGPDCSSGADKPVETPADFRRRRTVPAARAFFGFFSGIGFKSHGRGGAVKREGWEAIHALYAAAECPVLRHLARGRRARTQSCRPAPGLVRPVAFDSRKPEGQAARV